MSDEMAANRMLRKVVERALDGSGASVGAVDQVVSEINDSIWLAQQRLAVAEAIAQAIEAHPSGSHRPFRVAAEIARRVGAQTAVD